MNIYHHPLARTLRSLARKSGLLKFVKPLLASRQKSYEESFHEALKSAVRPGDIVWDVGANVGVYTKLFLDWAGPGGRVVAFEPLPKALEALTQALNSHPSIGRAVLIGVALADRAGRATFAEDSGGKAPSTTGHLAEQGSNAEDSIAVEVSTADLIVDQQSLPWPTVVKIDVEGFEEDVLKGGSKVFGAAGCREVLVEMHFTRMDERGLGNSADRIVKRLKQWGYKVTWVDPSHLHAQRSRA